FPLWRGRPKPSIISRSNGLEAAPICLFLRFERTSFIEVTKDGEGANGIMLVSRCGGKVFSAAKGHGCAACACERKIRMRWMPACTVRRSFRPSQQDSVLQRLNLGRCANDLNKNPGARTN